MNQFVLSDTVIEKVLTELESAEKYIRIAVFQIHLAKLFDLLERKLKDGIKVEIFTLPYDSINESVAIEVTNRLESLKKKGAVIYFCKWNVGDPERTTTAVGRWYSFHGKFIVTDKSAIILSANFTSTLELDACIIYEKNSKRIEEFNNKFDELVELFVKENAGYDGDIRQLVEEKLTDKDKDIFSLPSVIQTDTHLKNWIRHYPAAICPVINKPEEKLYIIPFEARARDLYLAAIEDADEFIYISAESFTDFDFANALMKVKLKGLTVKIICGALTMDFPDRIQKMFRELIAYDIEVKTMETDLHAKLLITDKLLLVGSVNLNKMNLGFSPVSKRYWRGNTETIMVCKERSLLKNARKDFDALFLQGINIEKVISENIRTDVGKLFSSTFGLKTRNEVKELFAKFILTKEIEVKKAALKLAKITNKLMEFFHKRIVGKDEFVMALILFYLSESKEESKQLIGKVNYIVAGADVESLLKKLEENKFIEHDRDYYKLEIDSLF